VLDVLPVSKLIPIWLWCKLAPLSSLRWGVVVVCTPSLRWEGGSMGSVDRTEPLPQPVRCKGWAGRRHIRRGSESRLGARGVSVGLTEVKQLVAVSIQMHIRTQYTIQLGTRDIASRDQYIR
jgi:hypothetical protein